MEILFIENNPQQANSIFKNLRAPITEMYESKKYISLFININAGRFVSVFFRGRGNIFNGRIFVTYSKKNMNILWTNVCIAFLKWLNSYYNVLLIELRRLESLHRLGHNNVRVEAIWRKFCIDIIPVIVYEIRYGNRIILCTGQFCTTNK